MDLAVIAVAFVALVGGWCLVVLPAMWLSGTLSQEEELARSDTGQNGQGSNESEPKEV